MEGVGDAHLLYGAVGQRHSVALGERELQLRFQGAFEVQVYLGLRKAGDEGLHGGVSG